MNPKSNIINNKTKQGLEIIMTKGTKKVGSTGRFGTRYGARLRKRVREIEANSKIRHRCPRCRLVKVEQKSVGIWECRKCEYKFAGGAWEPQTNTGKRSIGQIRQIQERRFDD